METESPSLEMDSRPSIEPYTPGTINFLSLQEKTHAQLVEDNLSLGIRVRTDSSRFHLTLDQIRFHLTKGSRVEAAGILEMQGDHGQLRWEKFSFKPCVDDVHINPDLVRKYSLQTGLRLTFSVRLPRERERGLMVDEILFIEDIPINEWRTPTPFDKLTPLFPDKRIMLEDPTSENISTRAVDLIAPLGLGQRGLIAAAPRGGKTMMLKAITKAIRKNHPEIHLMLLLVDERPEEVTDFRRETDAHIFSSTFDEPVTRHVQICELVSERSQRLVELGKPVVILVDSITRVARGYNNLQPNKGRAMSGGVDSRALLKPRKFFGSARNTEEGGSLTILATALVETHSRMDDLIFEEFKGTGNMELHLDRSIAEQRVFPAIHIVNSGTRREELLYHPDEYSRIVLLRRQLSELPAGEAMEVLVKNLRRTKTNAELLLSGLKGF